MRILLLGGTKFLGRHLVDAALAQGHEVTIFTRGRLPNPWPGRVTALTGDRDPAVPDGMAALQHGSWDAVIDTSGYLPRVVTASTALLHERSDRYVFVSSISVYADASRPGLEETAPVAILADPEREDIPQQYGALKAACEQVVQHRYDSSALIIRPGLIVGPWDATDRFGYWVARFLAPHLLGDRLSAVLVPEPPERPLQVIDARDLAAWIIHCTVTGTTGVFNATSPRGHYTMATLITALEGLAQQQGMTAHAQWVAEARLEAAGVVPWTGLPLWIPTSDVAMAGFDSVSTARAEAAGLRHRELVSTLRDTATWLLARDNGTAWQAVLKPEQERAILDHAN